MSKLVEFLQKLGEDAAFAERYSNDPRATAEASGLSGEAIDALLAGDIDQLRSLSGLDNLAKTQSTVKAY